MTALVAVVLAVSRIGCGSVPGGDSDADPFAKPGQSAFVGTVTGVAPDNADHPFLKWVVTLKVDKAISGPPVGEAFWFAVHSPSQDDVAVGQRYRVRVKRKGDGYDIVSRFREN